MKKLFLLSVLAVILPTALLAQDDDMYFVPTKKNVEKAKRDYGMPRDTYYSGSNRSVDEYNRRYVTTVQTVDSLGNVIGGADMPTSIVVGDSIGSDIIALDGVAGVYPDSLGDYTYTRRMSRWDDYEWRDGYRAGYSDGRWGRWGWSTGYYPYYSGWYGGWYDPWYDPWYYGGWGYWGHAGWYDPWWGWGYPGYWHGHWHGGWYPSYGIAWSKRSTGTRNHSSSGAGYNYRRYNSIGGNRGFAGNRGNSNVGTGNNRNPNFGGVRNSNGNNYQNNSSSSSKNASFGGTRSGGGSHSSGGSRGGGGGRFGGGRR